jgi:tellurite resistance protein
VVVLFGRWFEGGLEHEALHSGYLLPTTMILLAPPAVGGLACFTLNGHAVDPVADSIAGLGVVLLLMQVGLLPRYRKLKFSMGFWSFTFPLAAAVSLTEQWLYLTRPDGWCVMTGVLLAAITVFIGMIGWRSLPGFSHE